MLHGELRPCGGGEIIPLVQTKLLVGRRSRCDISLRFGNVSSQHCELEFKSGYWNVRDLRSKNGTKVNCVRIESKVVMPGDEVMFAKHSFNLDYMVAADAAPPEEESPFALSLLEKAGLNTERRGSTGGSSSGSAPKKVRRSSPKDQFLMDWLSDD